jgi:hypothetical protein
MRHNLPVVKNIEKDVPVIFIFYMLVLRKGPAKLQPFVDDSKEGTKEEAAAAAVKPEPVQVPAHFLSSVPYRYLTFQSTA